MKHILIFTFVAMFLLLTSCNRNITKLSENFTLSFDQSTLVKTPSEKIKIEFVELVEESRCPTEPGVACVWAGYVTIKVKINDQEALLSLGDTNKPYTSQFEDHVITLLAVNYGHWENQGKAERYSVKLRVD